MVSKQASKLGYHCVLHGLYTGIFLFSLTKPSISISSFEKTLHGDKIHAFSENSENKYIAKTELIEITEKNKSDKLDQVQVIGIIAEIRETPSENSEIKARATRGTLLQVLDKDGMWFFVKYGFRDDQVGWILQEKAYFDENILLEFKGEGPLRFTRPVEKKATPEEFLLFTRPEAAVSESVSTLPYPDPDQFPGPNPNLPGKTVALPDRWRIMQSLGFKFPFYDPYNQNVLKGDLPVLKDYGDNLFFNLGIISDNLSEHRDLPTPVSQAISFRPDALDIYGGRKQSIFASTVIVNLSLTKGNTTFRPPDYELRFAPAFQYNRVEVKEAGALYINPSRGRTRYHNFVGLQEFFYDYHIRNVSARYDFDSVRVGIQPFISDFRGFLFNDLPFGVRLFGNRDNNIYQYNLAWFRRLEKDTNSGLNDPTKSLRGDDIFVGNLYRQDWPILGMTSQWTILHNRNREDRRRYDTNGFLVRPSLFGDVRAHTYNVTYLGYTLDGHIGWEFPSQRINVSSSTYLALGKDDRSPFSGTSQEIRAFFHATELSRDFSWFRLRGNVLLSSGDSDPYDNVANGYDAVFENPQFAGADTSQFIRQPIPLIGGGGVVISGRNGILPSLRSSKEQGQSNFQNPGLFLLGVGVDIDVLPELRLVSNLSHYRFMKTEILGALRNEKAPNQSLGTELVLGVQWRPFFNQNFIVNASTAYLKYGSGLKQLFGNRDNKLTSTFVNILLIF
tara:strand:+ start:9966 stop:12158 length:2193 start_codon:yes stop_codon:yes gene_type:complete